MKYIRVLRDDEDGELEDTILDEVDEYADELDEGGEDTYELDSTLDELDEDTYDDELLDGAELPVQ